jgi:hypothetical protein
MVTLFLLWLALLAAAVATGAALIPTQETGDPFSYAAITGLLLLPAPLLVISLFTPLAWWHFVLVWTLLPLLLWLIRRPSLPRPHWTPLLVLLAANAWSSSGPVMLHDTGLYHYPLLEILDTFGTIPGQAFLHHRFGFSSAWIAAPAALDEGWLDGRTATVLNGLLMALAMYHFARSLAGWLRAPAPATSGYFSAGYLVLFLFCNVSQRFEVSLSPNWPVALALLLALAAPPAAALLLASAAAAIKLSALPVMLLLAARHWRRWRLVLPCLALLAPLLAANLVASGCPAYPSIPCLDAPSTALARYVTLETRNWARWAGPNLLDPTLLRFDWVPGWLARYYNGVLTALTLLASLVAFRRPPWRFAVCCALAAWLYVMAAAPDYRFAIGAVAALAGFACVSTTLPARLPRPSPTLLATLGALALVANSVAHELAYQRIFRLTHRVLAWERVLRPYPIAHHRARTPVTTRFELEFHQPPGADQCWGAQPPCSPGPVVPARFCSPAQGLSGGVCPAASR